MYSAVRTINPFIAFLAIYLNPICISELFCQDLGKSEVSITGLSKSAKKISSALKKKGLSKVPSASQALSQNSSSSSDISNSFLMSVSGTPPTLPEIANSSIENIFWRTGVVEAIANGTPQPPMCQEFFSSNVDGFSGGLGACHMAEGVGHSFQTILESEVSLCYMKNLPTKANLKGGGVTLNKGKFPENNITKLFTPGDSNRLVKINVPAIEEDGPVETIFIKIPSIKSNDKAKHLYRAEMYFCPQGMSQPRGYNLIQIANSGVMKIIIGNSSDPFGGGSHSLTIEGSLSYANSEVKWDTSKSRRTMVDVFRNDSYLKSESEITSSNQIILKRRDSFDNKTVKDYTISEFSGSDALSAIFLQGAFKGEKDRLDGAKTFFGATEYRDTYYASAPNSSLLAQVRDYDISGDEFYTSPPTITVDTSKYSCNAKANIEISMIKGNATLESSLQPCFQNRLRRMDFCRSSELVKQAEENHRNVCIGPNQ